MNNNNNKDNKILNDRDDLVNFVKETRKGTFSSDSLDLPNILKYTISRDELTYVEETENDTAILYGLY